MKWVYAKIKVLKYPWKRVNTYMHTNRATIAKCKPLTKQDCKYNWNRKKNSNNFISHLFQLLMHNELPQMSKSNMFSCFKGQESWYSRMTFLCSCLFLLYIKAEAEAV